MRNQITSVAAAILLIANSENVEARKQLVDVNENRIKEVLVKTETCEDYCIFGTDNEDKVYWCISFSEPLVTFGWEYDQDANTSEESEPLKYLRFDLLFYLQN